MQRAFIVDVRAGSRVFFKDGGWVMENKRVIMKCCICGRVKTDDGWEYRFYGQDDGALCSHGFCTVCYEAEIKKIKIQTALPAMMLYR